MSFSLKLEEGVFYAFDGMNSITLKAEDIYCFAFGGVPTKNKHLSSLVGTAKKSFPDIRFSKFSVSPKIVLKLENEIIYIDIVFDKSGKTYTADFFTFLDIDYAFAGNTWCYYSGEYYQIIEILEVAKIHDRKISFRQYVDILNRAREFPGLHIDNRVSSLLGSDPIGKDEAQPAGLLAVLYPYQSLGYRWLKYITDSECGCILGDEMGLGKTIQVISLLIDRKEKALNPSLVVAPLSLLENWKREIKRFAPELSIAIHHGNTRTGRYKVLLNYDVIITSYGTTISDLSMLQMINWDLLVLDEAQNIKNPHATRTMSIKQIPHRAAIAVTGTPFENHISDIWSLLDFAIPGCLGSLTEFTAEYDDTLLGAEKIEPVLTALMLRRKVADVAQDLPEKVIIPQPLAMEEAEALRYEDTRRELLTSFNRKSATLAALTKLRMYCTHPFLLGKCDSQNNPLKVSTKYSRFCELVDEIVEQNEKVIVFTSYTEMFEIIKSDISNRFNIPVECINGNTPPSKRQEIVDRFGKMPFSAMLVLNPRAAGVGLNITAANHVIHYNLEWNPALEDQATARAFRRGQDKTVFVYRLFYANTVEEIVNEKIENKRMMSEAAVVGSEGTEDTKALILRALGMSPLKEG